MISARNRSTVQCGQAIAKGGCAQRAFFTIQPARLPPNLHRLKKKQQQHCFYLPTQEPTTGPNCLSQQGPTPPLGSQGPPLSAPLCHGCTAASHFYPFACALPSPTALPLLSVHMVLPGLKDLALIPLFPCLLQEVSQTAPGLTVPSSL